MRDLAKMILKADLLRAMSRMLAWIRGQAESVGAKEAIAQCEKSEKIVGDLLRRETH